MVHRKLPKHNLEHEVMMTPEIHQKLIALTDAVILQATLKDEPATTTAVDELIGFAVEQLPVVEGTTEPVDIHAPNRDAVYAAHRAKYPAEYEYVHQLFHRKIPAPDWRNDIDGIPETVFLIVILRELGLMRDPSILFNTNTMKNWQFVDNPMGLGLIITGF